MAIEEKITPQLDWGIQLKNCTIEDLENNLSINEDHYKMMVKQQPLDLHIRSRKDYFNYVKSCAEQYKERSILLSGGKAPKFKDTDIYKLIKEYKLIYISAIPYKDKKRISYQINYWVKDYGNTKGLYEIVDIPQLINVINDVFEIANFSSLLNNVLKKIMTIQPDCTEFPKLNLAPSYLTLFNNGVLNNKTFEFSTSFDEFGEYDFISKINYKLVHPDLALKSHYTLINKLLHDWTDNDEEKITLLKQLGVSVIDGDGRDNYIIIIGAGGNGKSIYLNLLSNLASGYSFNLDMQDVGDDNKVNDISEDVRLILGHELATNSKFTGGMISRIKQLATADPFKANVKFEKSRTILTKCLKIQATNTVPKIFENNQAILRRIKLVQWTNKDFSKLENNIDLDELIKDPEFIEAFISYIFMGITKFDKFITIKSVEEDSANAVNDADQVYQFLLWAEEQGLLVGEPPINGLYQMYVNWNRDENPGSRPLKAKEFTARLKTHLDKFGLQYVSERITISKINKLNFNLEVLNKYFFNFKLNINKLSQSRYIICKDQITNDYVDEIQEKLEQGKLDFEGISYKELLAVYYLANLMDNAAISFVKTIEELNQIEM